MRIRLMAVLAAAAVAGACSESRPPTAPESISVPVQFDSAAHAGAAVPHNYRTHLSGKEEVPVRETRAQGQAIFQISRDGASISYKLIVANIENVFQAHIHIGAVGANGPVVVWLYPSTAPVAGPLGAGRMNGVIAEGTITGADLVGMLAGQPLSALIDAINAGNTYVNVHTNDGVAPTNTGPGDFPGGEIRGQID
jgi:hypothetical protein